jgi:hypothetical protein
VGLLVPPGAAPGAFTSSCTAGAVIAGAAGRDQGRMGSRYFKIRS